MKLSITDSILAAEIVALESALNCRVAAADGRGIESLLSPQFYEFGASGKFWTYNTIVDALKDEPIAKVQMTYVEVIQLAEDTVLLTYRAIRAVEGEKNEVCSLRSSIWSRADGNWLMIFHQGTLTV